MEEVDHQTAHRQLSGSVLQASSGLGVYFGRNFLKKCKTRSSFMDHLEHMALHELPIPWPRCLGHNAQAEPSGWKKNIEHPIWVWHFDELPVCNSFSTSAIVAGIFPKKKHGWWIIRFWARALRLAARSCAGSASKTPSRSSLNVSSSYCLSLSLVLFFLVASVFVFRSCWDRLLTLKA